MPGMSNEYGGALFELAKDEGITKEILDALRAVDKLLSENPGYIAFLCTPGIPLSERKTAIRQAFDGNVHEYVCSFIEMLTERGHMRGFSDCVNEYVRKYNACFGISVAEVRSAVPLTRRERDKLTRKLEAMSGRRVNLIPSVDPGLIGGLIIRMDGKLIDGSLRTRLNELHEVLSK